jgi:hypothetical protein
MPTINRGDDYFQVVTYTGNGSTNTITGLRFQPDFVWIKGRSGATDHALYDAVRGTTKDLVSNSTAAETTQSTGLTSFNSDGFTLGALSKVNTNAATYVAWCWKANGAGSSNTSGSITSTVSVNTTAGFSIVTWQAPAGLTNQTIGHGLGVAPKLIINKSRNVGGLNWFVYHSSIPTTQYLSLNTTAAATTSSPNTQPWNNTSPTSTVFTIGDINNFWGGGFTYVSYCWAEIAGFSKFGSYTGNGSADGPFVFTNFRPKYVMIKRTDGVGPWYLLDSVRNTYNVMNLYVEVQDPAAEATFTFWDFVSNGFKLRTSTTNINGSSQSFIYMAFAENPFKNALAR